jgi:ABC-2 type transport system ATP-binding protein
VSSASVSALGELEPQAPSAEGSTAISVRGLTKIYGSFHALDNVELDVPEGSVYGFLGPNGAGKTTTLRILTGLAKPSAGSATIFGAPAGSATARSAVGFLPDVPGFYEWMTAEEFLRFAGGLFGLARDVLDERVRVLLGLAGLAEVDTKIGGFSRGMKQRLGVAQALVNAPRLLMLDEPTSALDPLGRKEVLDMVAALGGRTTVFFSTHILADVERVCDQVAILDRGRVVAEAPIAELKSRYAAHRLVLEVTEGTESIAEELRRQPWAQSVEVDGETIAMAVADVEEAQVAVPAIVSARGLGMRRFEGGEVSLEEVFVDLVGEANRR